MASLVTVPCAPIYARVTFRQRFTMQGLVLAASLEDAVQREAEEFVKISSPRCPRNGRWTV